MSLKRTAASKPNRRIGCRVTSAANSGVRTISTNVCFSFNARYSGNERPAWRINHTGGRSKGEQRHAARNRSRLLRFLGGPSRSTGGLTDRFEIAIVLSFRPRSDIEAHTPFRTGNGITTDVTFQGGAYRDALMEPHAFWSRPTLTCLRPLVNTKGASLTAFFAPLDDLDS